VDAWNGWNGWAHNSTLQTMSQFPTPQEAKEQRNDENRDEDIKQNLGDIDCSPRHSAKTENGPNDGDEKKYQGIPEHKE